MITENSRLSHWFKTKENCVLQFETLRKFYEWKKGNLFSFFFINNVFHLQSHRRLID